jgi:hypothetical protein
VSKTRRIAPAELLSRQYSSASTIVKTLTVCFGSAGLLSADKEKTWPGFHATRVRVVYRATFAVFDLDRSAATPVQKFLRFGLLTPQHEINPRSLQSLKTRRKTQP